MGVDPVGSIHGRVTQSPADVWAEKLATKLDEMRNSTSSAASSPNVATSAAYTPSVFAQAASFQVYNQAGAVAALSSGAHVASQHLSAVPDHPDDIAAVDGASGGIINTVA